MILYHLSCTRNFEHFKKLLYSTRCDVNCELFKEKNTCCYLCMADLCANITKNMFTFIAS